MFQILKTSGTCDVCGRYGFDLVCLAERVSNHGPWTEILVVGHKACYRADLNTDTKDAK